MRVSFIALYKNVKTKKLNNSSYLDQHLYFEHVVVAAAVVFEIAVQTDSFVLPLALLLYEFGQ